MSMAALITTNLSLVLKRLNNKGQINEPNDFNMAIVNGPGLHTKSSISNCFEEINFNYILNILSVFPANWIADLPQTPNDQTNDVKRRSNGYFLFMKRPKLLITKSRIIINSKSSN